MFLQFENSEWIFLGSGDFLGFCFKSEGFFGVLIYDLIPTFLFLTRRTPLRSTSPRGPNSNSFMCYFKLSIENGTPFTYLHCTVETLYLFFIGSVRDILKGPFEYLNESFLYPFLYLRNPYPFIYLQPEKGTLSGRASL